ncbi:MAG: Tad domain-containing protein [Acidimicrobiales bacterium]|nr:Tad domain-containing protein [Acidimicrobiales bacterium]
MLLAFAGFAIDVGNWWWSATRIQKAADAAALGGVVYMPGNPSSAATLARSVATANGYTNGTGGTTVAVNGTARPNQLQVTITGRVTNFFAGLLGFATTNITRSALAEFDDELPMGSPTNKLANDPDNPQTPYPEHWLNTAAPNATKVSGDRFAARQCASGWQCSGGVNNEWDTNNYFFAVDVGPTAVASGQPLRIEVFDPAYVYVGDLCTVNLPNATQLATLVAQGYTDAATRYASGSTSAYCTGDMNVGGSNEVTSYLVRSPDSTPWDPANNPVISSCSRQYQPTSAAVYPLLNGQVAQVNNPAAFPGYFRRWATICTINNPVEGQYFLQVRSTAATGSPETFSASMNSTGGHNRYSVRAGMGATGEPAASDVKVFAKGRLPIYTNVAATGSVTRSSTFYLVRVTPAPSTGRILNLQFWDIGDTSSGDVDLFIQAPSESAAFTGCQYTVDGGSLTNAPNCAILDRNSGNSNGRLYQMSIPISTSYTCNEGDVTNGCWVKVRMDFTNAQPNDTTTWGANITGDPVRLVG